MRLLLVEDDTILAESLQDTLVKQGYVVDIAQDGEEGWDFSEIFTYDLILLDVSLPKLDGISLCRRLRNKGNNSPILLLTAKDTSEAKVAGLDAGADDYVVKPCTISELFARIRALLRRHSESSAPVLEWGDLRLDPSRCEVTYRGRLVQISPKEYSLLELLMRHPQRVFSKSLILEHLWSFEELPTEDTIRAHIKGLRRKLKPMQADEMIETVYGMGYRLKPLANAKKSHKSAESPADSTTQTLNAVGKIWERYKAPILERLQTIEKAITLLESASLTESLREDAQQQAHKLAGSLGMYGLGKGSELAHEIEGVLETISINSSPASSVSSLSSLSKQLRNAIEDFSNNQQKAGTLNTSDSRRNVTQTLLVISQDSQLSQQLQQEIKNWQFGLHIVEDLNIASTEISQHSPSLILFHLLNNWQVLEETINKFPQIPIMVLSDNDSFEDRLRVTRLGGKGFLAQPLLPQQILESATALLKRHSAPVITILGVDDDPIILDSFKEFLSPVGIEFHGLQDPSLFWGTLAQITPDLLILDIEMPSLNGIELCQVVRSDPFWHNLPILFLSAHKDSKTIQQIYQAGGDDYISKPVTKSELITRIFNRLQRSNFNPKR